MADNKKSAKSEFEAVYEKEDARYKVTLLEKHLMECREEYNQLKQEELALRERQVELVKQMQDTMDKTKKVDEILASSIDSKIDSIKTEMFDEWQNSVKEAIVGQVAALTENKLKEYEELYNKQNEIIENQAEKFKTINMSTRIIRILSYTVCFVATLVLLFIPIAEYLIKDIKVFLEEPSLWGGVVLFTSVLLMILAIALAILLRKKTPKE